jgi:hypothetical protein
VVWTCPDCDTIIYSGGFGSPRYCSCGHINAQAVREGCPPIATDAPFDDNGFYRYLKRASRVRQPQSEYLTTEELVQMYAT